MEAVLAALKSQQPAALATVVHTSGSTPQAPGARLLLLADGTAVGTVGGGAVEQRVLSELGQVIESQTPRMFRKDLTRDLGMCCGGSMEIFLEPIVARPRLLIFGAGHIAVPTARLAQTVGFDVTVADDREALNTEARFPGCERSLCEPGEHLKQRPCAPGDWVLIVTHDHRLDEEALELSLGQDLRYIGLVGSRRKVKRLLDRVKARRGQLPALDHVYAPVGVDLGAVTPDEIAVSIVAEWIALRRGAEARHLRTLPKETLATAPSEQQAAGSSEEARPKPAGNGPKTDSQGTRP